MNLTNTKIIDAAIEQKRYPNSEELNHSKIWLKERRNEIDIANIVSNIKQDILNTIRINLSSKTELRIRELNLKNAILEQRFSENFSKYVATCIDYVDTCLRLTSYSLILGDIERLLKEISPNKVSDFVDVMGISLKIIFENFDEIKYIVISRLSTDFKNKFLEYFQPISKVILDRLIVQKIYRQALDLFEDEEETQHWFSTPKTRLEAKTPLEAMKTKAGAEKVEEILYQAEFGMVS
jgi:uncharacterized protein (DUF2384 family)